MNEPKRMGGSGKRSTTVSKFRSRLRGALFLFGLYIALIVFFSCEVYFYKPYKDTSILEFFSYNFSRWFPWVLLTPMVVVLGRRFPFDRLRWRSALPVHTAACAVMTAVHAGMALGFNHLSVSLGFTNGLHQSNFLFTLGNTFNYNVLTYIVIILVTTGLDHYRKNHERELRTSRLETRLTLSELQVLKMQIHPHFLFNTLHAISTLVHKDADAADQMISGLSDLLRLGFTNPGLHEVPFHDELEFIKLYLDIMKTRFGDRLQVKLDIPGEAFPALVPSLFLQPLVENAIRHSIASRLEGGKVTVCVCRRGDRLVIEVADDGPGFRLSQEEIIKNGVGLANSKERLRLLYGDDHRFELRDAEDGGARVILDIPFRTEKRAQEIPPREIHDDPIVDR